MRNDIQLGQVCRILCGLAHRAEYWAHEDPHDAQIGQLRPTPMACAVAQGKEACSHGEYVLIQVAWAFWNGGTLDDAKSLGFVEVIQTLDSTRARAVAELMIAESCGDSEVIDQWITRWTRPAFPLLRKVGT